MAFSKTLAEMEQLVPDSAARNRLVSLFDEDSFTELDKFLSAEGKASSVVSGYGTVNGTYVYAYAQDVEVRSGAVDKSAALKIKRIYELAAKNGAPVVSIFDSKGGDITEGVEVLADFGEIISASAAVSGVVPQIAVVTGVCAGAMAVLASMADITVMSESAELFLSAPFNAPDGKIEGAGKAANAAKSGVADIVAKDADEALAVAKKLAAVLPANNISLAFNEEAAENDAAVSASMSGEQLAAAVADKNSVIELGAGFGSAAYTALASIDSATVAMVATDRAEKLTPADCAKIARFVQLADVFSVPVVTFVNTKGFEPSSAAELSGSVRDAAKLAQVYASATTAKVNVVTGNAFGAAYTAFGNADVTFAWEKAAVAPMSPEAAKVFLGKEIDTTPFGAASVGMIESVIAAEDTKAAVASAVDLLKGKRVASPARKHINFVF